MTVNNNHLADDTGAPVIEAVHLTRTVGSEGDSRTIVDDFTCAFSRGLLTTIIGPSGAGKSSLLRLFNRLDEPTSGQVLFDGRDSSQYDPCQLRRRVGYLLQTPYMFPGTVGDNILFAENSLSESDVRHLADQAQIPRAMIDQDSSTLSVGEKQRVALARLLATDPEVILLDEPTAALDPSHTESIERLITELMSMGGRTVIMVTHNPRQALRMGGQTVLMVHGRLAEAGPCEQVVGSPQTESGRLFKEKRLK